MMDVTLAGFCSTILLAILYYWMRYTYSGNIRYLRSLPTGFPTLPLIGHLHYFIFSFDGPQTNIIFWLKKISSLQLRLFCIWFGPSPIVFISDPEDVQMVLNKSKTINKISEYKLFRFCFGDGLLTAEVPLWKVTRRHILSLFHPSNLDQLVPVFNKTSQKLVQQLQTKTGKKPFDISDDLLDFGVQNIVCLLFGSKVEGKMDSISVAKMKESVLFSLSLSGARGVIPWLRLDSIFNFVYKKQIQNIKNLVYCLPASIIKDVEEFETPQEKSTDNLDFESKGFPAVQQNQVSPQRGNRYPLTLTEIYKFIREQHIPLKKEDFIYEINTFLITGTDTISVVLSNCLLSLAVHPNIQSKVYQEIVDEIGQDAGVVSYEDVKKLRYMDCVLKESMRLINIVPFVLRTNECDIQLGDYTLPAGTKIAINLLGMHQNPQHFPDPERFDPDRFSADNVAQRHKYAFLPFSGGARDCIGKQYVWILTKIALVHLLREYQFTTNMDINTLKFNYMVLIAPKDGYQISVEKRKI